MGLFLVVEIKEFRKGVAICVLGIALTFLLNFVFIPFFIQGLSIHATSSINPFAHIDLKLIMLFKALLSVGFFLLFRPQTLLYVFPSYGAYLIGGKTEFFWLLYHYHDFTTTILHIAGLFVIKQLIQTPQSTWVRYYFKIIACLLFLVGFLKLPLFKMLEKAESIYELYETRIELLDLKPLIQQDHNVFSTEGLSEYLLSYKYARSLDNNSLTRHQDIFYKNSSIIFPKNQKFSQLSKSRYISVLTDLTEKSKLGICLHYDNYTYLHYFRCN